MKNYNFVLNKRTGTLHRLNCCHYSNVPQEVAEKFETEDDAISFGTRYIKHCKNCFKNKI